MQDLKGKFFSLSIVVFLVLILLISNLGQDFKDDIFSYNNAIGNSNSLIKYWDKSKEYQDYLNSSSDYIAKILEKNGLRQLNNKSYIEEWNSNLPTFHGNSTLDVLTSYGRVVKTYEYGKDFFEDFRGIIKPGVALGKPSYLPRMDSNLKKFPKVLLFSGYKNKQLQEIASIDSTLLSQGVSAVISPSSTNYLKYDSGLYESSFIESKEGLSKLIVTPFIFEELREFADKGYSIKIKSSGLIEATQLKNIYGILAGKNKAYKPLVIATFYDGVYKTSDIDSNDFKKYSITPSIITDCIRALNLQRSLKPDRTIIFAFLSGYNQNKEGQKKLLEKDIIADYMVFDGLGTGDKNMLALNKGSKYFASTIEAKLRKNSLEVLSKSVNTDSATNLVYITTINLDMKDIHSYPYINKSGKFLLSIIDEECYDLDFLSGNIRELRVLKRFVKEKTLLIASLTFLFLLVIIFRKSGRKTSWHFLLHIIKY